MKLRGLSVIYYIAKYPETLYLFLETWGKDLARQVRILSYDEINEMNLLPLGTYIFSDIERLTPEETEHAAEAWNALHESDRGVRVLNDPIRSMRRYELLRCIYEGGINDFNVYRLTEERHPHRFPVFLRRENDHNASITPLLHTVEELHEAIEVLSATGKNRQDKIILEFADVSDDRGIYHVYGAFIVGSEIVAAHYDVSLNWQVKYVDTEPDLEDDEFVLAERAYVNTNPHKALLQPIFETARIDYGRMDYAVVDGKVRVFEINTNPTIIEYVDGGGRAWMPATRQFCANLLAALQKLNHQEEPVRCVPVQRQIMDPVGRLSRRLRYVLRAILRFAHLLEYEAPIVRALLVVRRCIFKI